jgi:hypothetical protein
MVALFIIADFRRAWFQCLKRIHYHGKRFVIDFDRGHTLTGRRSGAKGSEFADYILETLDDPRLEKKWRDYRTRPLVA